MSDKARQIAINVQFGMTIFFLAGAVLCFIFLRDSESWLTANLWWISLLVGLADLAALVFMIKKAGLAAANPGD